MERRGDNSGFQSFISCIKRVLEGIFFLSSLKIYHMKGRSHQIVTGTTQHIEKEIEKTYNRSQVHPMPICPQDNLKITPLGLEEKY